MTGLSHPFRQKNKHERLLVLRRFFYFIGLLLGGGIFIYQIVSGICSVLQKKQIFIQPFWLILALLLAILVTWMQMMGWLWMMAGMGTQLKWKDVLQGYVLSFIPRYIPGSIWGYISRGEWLNHSFDVPFSVTNFGSVLEMFFILIANVFWIVSGITTNNIFRILMMIITIMAAWMGWWLIKILIDKPVFVRIIGPESAKLIRSFSLRRWLLITSWMILFWGVQGLSFQMVLSSMSSAQVSNWTLNNYWVATSSYNLAWFVGFIILFVPAGLGLRETVLSELIETRLKQSTGLASIVSIVFRVVLAFGEVFWAVVAIRQKRISFYRKNTPNENDKISTVSKE